MGISKDREGVGSEGADMADSVVLRVEGMT